MNGEPLFRVRNLSKDFAVARHASLKAVDGVSFDIAGGETLGVVGESGSGKSTLGRCLLGLIPASGGEVLYGGEDLLSLTPRELKRHRREMQMIFQNPKSSFNAKMSIRKCLMNVARFYGMNTEAAERRIAELLDLTGLPEDALYRRSDQLSGGQLQRFAIVRALIPNPRFLVADEAVSALDVSVQAQILNLFGDLKKTLDLTTLFISHDLTVVEYICDRVIVLYLGQVIESADAAELFRNPLHPYTVSLLEARPKTDPDEVKNYKPLEGEIPSALNLPPGCRFHTRCPRMIPGVCDAIAPPETEPSAGHFVRCHLRLSE